MTGSQGVDGLKVAIVCHGDAPSEALLREECARADMVLCTDGVAAWVEGLGVDVDFVIGDLDSLGGAAVTAPVVDAGPHEVQESSDSEKALQYALTEGADEVVLLGATGGRLDHTMANLALAAKYAGRARVWVVDDLGWMEVVRGRRELKVAAGARLSLVALAEGVEVHTRGLRWELAGPLELGTRGLSNTATGDEVTLDVTGGAVALIMLHGTDGS